MRSTEFTQKRKQLERIDLQGLSPLDWIILTECERSNTTLLESLDPNSIEYLQGLTHYSAVPIIGKKYIPLMLMLMSEPTNRLSFQGGSSLVTLLKIRQVGKLTIYDFINGLGLKQSYPENRLSELSFSQLYVFETAEQFNMFSSALASKFNVDLPKVDFDES
jgi:hypothetical protein